MFNDRIVFDAERAHGDPAFAAGRQVEERRCGESGTAPVCSYPEGESSLGVCDLGGNAWEWVEDGYNPNYNSAPADGSAAEGVGATKVVRGGGWRAGPETLTSTYRLEMSPSVRFDHIGVRLVKSVSAPEPAE